VADSVGFPPRAAAPAPVLSALRSASAATGVDFGYLVSTARRESNFNPLAKASTSSAEGLFQFTNATWLDTIARYGARHGVDTSGMTREDILALRSDPDISARMGAELTADNARRLEQATGRRASPGELYLAHFLGVSDAARLIDAAKTRPDAPAADLFARAAEANPTIFRDPQGVQLSAADLYQKLTGAGAPETVALAAAGPPAGEPVLAASALLQARLGTAALASTLMSALFDFQEETRS
jgi:hypothetical protein